MKCTHAIAAMLVLTLSVFARPAAPAVVSSSEQAAWIRWLIPLPKQVAIDARVDLAVSSVQLTVLGKSNPAIETTADHIRKCLQLKTDAKPRSKKFEIILGICNTLGRLGQMTVTGGVTLSDLPNAEQAYLIRPIGTDRIVLTALDERGLYYAAQTFCQLLEHQVHNGQVSIPLVTVLDWPDLSERGLWGGSANRDLVWMSHYKMNLVESHVTLKVTDDGRAEAQADQQLIDRGRSHALQVVPVITHLNGLEKTGIYNAYPELMGKGEHVVHATHKNLIAPCCSQLKLAEVLSDWMSLLAGQPGVTTVCAWLSELRNQYCGCPQCRATGVGQFALEARCLVRACRLARKNPPDLQLRLLLTQGSYETNAEVLAEIPADVEVTYYDGGRTYDSSRDPMIYPLLEQYAASGHWLGCYPQLTASWRIVCPWSCPQFVRFRMNEFMDKKLKCFCGYATPDNRLYEFNVTAAAEWSWNASGRDAREFAVAYWTRKGFSERDAETAADWAVLLGPVGWDVYGSRIPAHNFFGTAAHLVSGRREPKLGEKGMFRYFPNEEHFDKDLAICQQAMSIAKQLDKPLLVNETQVIEGYVRMTRSIYSIAEQVHRAKRPTAAQRQMLQKELGQLAIASLDTTEALKRWERFCRSDPNISVGGSRLSDTIDMTVKTASDIAKSLERVGIRNVVSSFLQQEIGKWVTEDFDQGGTITKQYDVTRYVRQPGTYQIRFKYTSGWNGLRISHVALAIASGDKTAEQPELTVLSEDKHTGSAAVRNVANEYRVTLENVNPSMRYFIVADVVGTPRQGRPTNRQGCNGSVSLERQRPLDWRAQLEHATPLSN